MEFAYFVQDLMVGMKIKSEINHSFITKQSAESLRKEISINNQYILVSSTKRPGGSTAQEDNSELLHVLGRVSDYSIPFYIIGNFQK